MKSILKSFVVAALTLSSASTFAQKAAFIDLDSLLSIMPEMTEAKKVSADYYKTLTGTLEAFNKELTDKNAEFQANEKNYTELIKNTKQKEIQDLYQRIQDFQQQAQTDFQKKNEDLTKPIHDKAVKSIEKVAKAKGYKMVVDASVGVLLYKDPADDLFNAVKVDLGIK